MFKHFLVEDLVSLEVSEYCGKTQKVLREKLEDRYVDKIIVGAGLVLLIEDISTPSKPTVLPNDACALFVVNLKLLVFSPERGERIRGTVLTSDASGIGVSLGFFAEIKVIPHLVPSNASFDKEQKAWCLEDNENKRCYRLNSAIDFVVVGVTYNERNGASKDEQLPVMLVLGNIQ